MKQYNKKDAREFTKEEVETISDTALAVGMRQLLRCYQVGRKITDQRKGNGVLLADIESVADAVKRYEDLTKLQYDFNPIGDDGKIVVYVDE